MAVSTDRHPGVAFVDSAEHPSTPGTSVGLSSETAAAWKRAAEAAKSLPV